MPPHLIDYPALKASLALLCRGPWVEAPTKSGMNPKTKTLEPQAFCWPRQFLLRWIARVELSEPQGNEAELLVNRSQNRLTGTNSSNWVLTAADEGIAKEFCGHRLIYRC